MKIRSLKYALLLAALLLSEGAQALKIPSPSATITFLREKARTMQAFTLSEIPSLFSTAPLLPNLSRAIGRISVAPTRVTASSTAADFEGMATIGASQFALTVHIDNDGNGSLSLMIPSTHSLKTLFPDLGAAGDLMNRLQRTGLSYLALSNYQYTDPTLQIEMYPGINIGTVVELTGILANAKRMMDNLRNTEFLIMDRAAAVCAMFIPHTSITNTTVGVVLPFRLGIDLTRRPFNLPNPYLRRIYTANYIANISLNGLVTISSGMFVELRSQAAPLEFRSTMVLDAKGAVALSAQMNQLYKPAFGIRWLGLGPLIGFGFSVSTTPPWLNGVTWASGVELGKLVQGAQGVVSFDILRGSLVLDFSIQKLDIDQIIKNLIEFGGHVGRVDASKVAELVPTIEYRNCQFTFVPEDCWVLGKYYNSGIQCKSEIQFGKFKGKSDININLPTALKVKAELEPLEIKVGKKNIKIFRISGNGPNNSLLFDLDLNVFDPSLLRPAAKLEMSARIELPPLKFSKEANVLFDMGNFVMETETKLGNNDLLHGHMKIEFDPKEPKDFVAAMEFEQNFVENIKNKAARKFVEILTAIIVPLEVKGASLYTSGEDLADGKLPHVELDLEIFGQNVGLDMQFDPDNIDDFFTKKVPEAILKKLPAKKLQEFAKKIKEGGRDAIDKVKKETKEAFGEVREESKKFFAKIKTGSKKAISKIKDWFKRR